MISINNLKYFFITFLLAALSCWAVLADAAYQQPQKEILDVIRAPSLPRPIVSPTDDKILLVSTQDYPSIQKVATPYLKLAGVRIEPKNHSQHDTPGGYGIALCVRGLEVVDVASGKAKKISIEKVACPDRPKWAADGKHFAFKNVAANSVELWIGDAETGRIWKAPGVQLNPMFGQEFQWMPDQKSLLVKLVPKSLGKMPQATASPIEPSIQENSGSQGVSSTYEARDTLKNKYDEALFVYFGTSQLAIVDLQGGVKNIGKPDLYEQLEPAPSGKHILVAAIEKPFSYLVTFQRFPERFEVWDISRPQNIATQLIAKQPLADRVPIHGVQMGPREFIWRPTDPATLIWAEALDKGDWNVNVPERDKIMMSKAPFKNPVEIFRTEQRYSGIEWFANPKIALLTDYDHNKHWLKTFIVNPEEPKLAKKILWDRSSEDQYGDPGNPVHETLKNGFELVRQAQDSIFLAGDGSSEVGERPFLDKLNLQSSKTERLFRSAADAYELFVGFPEKSEKTFLTWHQTVMSPPNAYKRVLGEAVKSPAKGEAEFASSSTAITKILDPTPQVRQIKKRLVKYKRADGLDLSFTLYTPPGYKEGTKLPTILNAYPMDFSQAGTAGQVSGSQAQFTRLRGYRLLLLAGYAVIDSASFPIIGDPKKAYDNYLDQLVADAKAAVDEAVRLGVADPNKIGVTGHSHGALMTANLVAHSNLFKAGAATSGSYNKTLTPFGFQNERRSVWEAPEVYQKVSPFFYADKLKTPLLIIHGGDDANPGTTPLQGSMLYEAVRGNGGTVRLVMLPYEPHWYTALESNEQQIYEMVRWFDKYVRGAK